MTRCDSLKPGFLVIKLERKRSESEEQCPLCLHFTTYTFGGPVAR